MRRILVSIATLATAGLLTLTVGANAGQAARVQTLPQISGPAATAGGQHDVTAAGVAVARAVPRRVPPVELGLDYYLRLRLNWSKCAEIPGWSKKNNQQADIWTCKNQANVKWKVTAAGTYGSFDTYFIKNSHSKKCLNVAGRSTRNGTKIIQRTCTYALNNRWRFVPHAGYYELKSMDTNAFINVAGGKATNGAKLVQWNKFGHANQDFFFDLV